jgi:hypothetical protein
MKRILVDSSVWIDYFSGGSHVNKLSELIENNSICMNDIILAELLPFLYHKKEDKLASLLLSVEKAPLMIDWQRIVDFQIVNLRHGINKVGIPDLMIVQNVLDNGLELFSLDKHFVLMRKLFKFNMFRV